MKSFSMRCRKFFHRTGQMFWGAGQFVMALLGPSPGLVGLKRWLLQIFILALLAGVGGFFVSAMGLVPITASSGHWPITAWFLNFTMSRSVSTHSLGTAVPPLDDLGMVMKGATHYHTGCFPCHGNPAIHHPRIARQMTPHPPYLPPVLHEWEPEELFYIVKHGVKFTGMPAWPTQDRDDEVWSIVAFLRKFPELDEQEYSHMVNGTNNQGEPSQPIEIEKEDAPIQALSGRTRTVQTDTDRCARCHGVDGQGRRVGLAPKLAGQQQAYLVASLESYARGNRPSGIMEPIAVGLSPAEIRELSRRYSKIKLMPPTFTKSTAQDLPSSEPALGRGAVIAMEGIPKARIPICAQCHGPGDNPRNPSYPKLAGQYGDYLTQQLQLFAEDRRGGSEFASLMHSVAERLTPEQIRDVALYYESLAVETPVIEEAMDSTSKPEPQIIPNE